MVAWIFALNIRLSAVGRLVFAAFFLHAGAVLMRTHELCINHGVIIVGLLRQMFENTFPDPGSKPTAEMRVHNTEITETLWQIAQGYPAR